MCSPLLFYALEANQKITDYVFRYRSVIYWDYNVKKFCIESRIFPHLFLWRLVNFGIIGCIGLTTCLFTLLHAFNNFEEYNAFEIFAILLQSLFATAGSASCWILTDLHKDLVPMLNELLCYVSNLTTCKDPCLDNQNRKHSTTIKRFKNKIDRDGVFFDDQKLDIIGLASLSLVFCFSLISFLLPAVGLYLNLDAPFFFFKYFFPIKSRSFLGSIGILLMRTTIAAFCVSDVATTFRTLALLAIYMFGLCSKCIQQMAIRAPIINDWRALRVLFIIANQLISVLITLYLAIVFYVLIICNTETILAAGKIPWILYLFYPLIGSMTSVIIVILFLLLISSHVESNTLKYKWMCYCGLSVVLKRDRFQRKILFKSLQSMQSITFSYGSLGKFTKGTRADYFYSIGMYSLNAILAARDYT